VPLRGVFDTESYPGIPHPDPQHVVSPFRADDDGPTLRCWIHGILHCIFHQGLDRHRWHRLGLPGEKWEKQAILDYQTQYPLEGYRRLTYMMIDADVVAVSPSSVFRVLRQADRLRRWAHKTSKKGTGFQQPLKPHEHWHIDISYINIHGTFYYPCAVLDGASRYLIAWSLRESMTEAEVEIPLQRAKEKFPNARPRIISDNGPQFIAKDFKEFIRISGMTHIRTAP